MQQEPISSLDLMERAATACLRWLERGNYSGRAFNIFCGKGNNGGDGLAIGRLLAERGETVKVSILEFGHKGSDDFQANLARLHQYPQADIRFIQAADQLHELLPGEIVIDALFGSGLNRPLTGIAAALAAHLNTSGCEVIAIDIPSGMFADHSSKGCPVVQAHHTLTFQGYKQAFLVAENAEAAGQVHLLDIGLHPRFYQELVTHQLLTDLSVIRPVYRPRKRFGHKGDFGHALIAAGSYGKMGAAVLSARACLHSGAGLLTCHIPGCGYDIMQVSLPEAMVITDFNSSFITRTETDLSVYDAVGLGPGLGKATETRQWLQQLLRSYKGKLVIDADGLNLLTAEPGLLHLLPAHTVLTPHPKEFSRLFGDTPNEFERLALASRKAQELEIVIVLKGHHTCVALPDGYCYYNSTGNAGMATAGSGDVLTGILTGLLAQGYSSREAALLGVFLHGLAGDIAADRLSPEAMLSGSIIDHLGEAFKKL